MAEVKTEFLFDIVAELDREGVVNVGTTPQGVRQIIYVKGGSVMGPRINGVVLPGGGDWLVARPDGATVLDVRLAIRTDDDQIIHMYSRGVSMIQPEVRERMRRGELVDPSEYYFRITPVFETGSEKYGWLNRLVAVGTGRITPGGVAYKIYAVL